METSLVSVDVGSEKQAYLLLALEWAPTELREALAAEELCLQTLLTPHTGSR